MIECISVCDCKNVCVCVSLCTSVFMCVCSSPLPRDIWEPVIAQGHKTSRLHQLHSQHGSEVVSAGEGERRGGRCVCVVCVWCVYVCVCGCVCVYHLERPKYHYVTT